MRDDAGTPPVHGAADFFKHTDFVALPVQNIGSQQAAQRTADDNNVRHSGCCVERLLFGSRVIELDYHAVRVIEKQLMQADRWHRTLTRRNAPGL